ncbi:MAG: hypothetical protein AAF447_19900 [Myxococcota bacterium]
MATPAPSTPGFSGGDLGTVSGLPSRKGTSRKGTGRKVALGVAALVLLALLAGGAVALLSGKPALRAEVVYGASGEALRIEAPEAPPGSKVRFRGAEVPLDAGAAELPLAADALRLGDNDLVVALVDPEGDADEVPLTLRVSYRVRPDFSALGGDAPELRVVVDAAPGAEVRLDETPVNLDGSGHGVQAFPLTAAESEGEVYERTVAYRITPPGEEPATGTVQARIPFTPLTVDRPLTTSVTDRERIEVAGTAGAGSVVTVNGERVALREGRFVRVVPLATPGEHALTVEARSDGRAPRRRVLTVQRVEDLAEEASHYATEEVDFARLVAAPESFEGTRVELSGRVYHADTQQGRPFLQMLVAGCRGDDCSLWVHYDGAGEVAIHDSVRVLGVLRGEQQYQTEGGQVRTDPKLEAAFVLPPAPRRGRRR